MSTHIETLAAWFDNGEAGTFTPGDVIISKNDDEYVITTINHSGTINPGEPDRILHRAPKPTPAWHDAVAVVASTSDFGIRRVFVKDVDGMWNDALSGRGSLEGNLLDVTPLIEQKVTDEMVQRIREASRDGRIKGSYRDVDGYYRDILTAALTLDPA